MCHKNILKKRGLVITTEEFMAIRVVVLYILLMKDTLSDEEPHRARLRASFESHNRLEHYLALPGWKSYGNFRRGSFYHKAVIRRGRRSLIPLLS